MTKTEQILRSILGPIRMDLRPITYAIDHTAQLLFIQKKPMDEILVTKDIYPAVAGILNKKPESVARSIERSANLCWDMMLVRGLTMKYLGAPLEDIRSARDILFYLAFYSYLDTPFFAATEQQMALLS